MGDHKGRHTLHKHCASDAVMLFFCLSIHTTRAFDAFMCDHKGRHTLHKHCASDAVMLFFCLIINTQQEDALRRLRGMYWCSKNYVEWRWKVE